MLKVGLIQNFSELMTLFKELHARETLYGFIFVLFVNADIITLTKNWICNIKSLGGVRVFDHTLFVATDAYTGYSVQISRFDLLQNSNNQLKFLKNSKQVTKLDHPAKHII